MKTVFFGSFFLNSMRKLCVFSLLNAVVLQQSCKMGGGSDTERAWNAANDPVILQGNKTLERKYSKLDTQAFLSGSKTPWSDFYWPTIWGGVSLRWNAPKPSYNFKLLSEASVKKMSPEQIATLSPAEKYDLLISNYNFSLTDWELKRTLKDTSGTKPELWWGLCHGWAAAALNYPEPKPVVLKNAEGLEIRFGSSDIKALLSLYNGLFNQNKLEFAGQRCDRDLSKMGGGLIAESNSEFTNAGTKIESLAECEDVNAGSFHLILANLIGIQNEGFVADLTAGAEVWNYPIHGYKVTELGEREPSRTAAPGTKVEKVVDTEVHFRSEVLPVWNRVNSSLSNSELSGVSKVVFRYALELNSKGHIIGGEWLTTGYPDFVWRQQRPQFANYFAKLDDLMRASVGNY